MKPQAEPEPFDERRGLAIAFLGTRDDRTSVARIRGPHQRVRLKPCPTGDYRPMDLIRILLSILLPPLGVFLQVGLGKHFWINVILTLLFYIPGLVHAIWVIAKK